MEQWQAFRDGGAIKEGSLLAQALGSEGVRFMTEHPELSNVTSDAAQNAQDYYAAHAQQLALTLAAFNNPQFKKYEGKQIRPNEITGLLNLAGIKAGEKELIRSVIDSKYAGAKTIPYDELTAHERASIIPLQSKKPQI